MKYDRLFDMEVLRKKFSKDTDDSVILLSVPLSKNNTCIVKCKFKVLHDRYGAIENIEIANTPITIGEKRASTILQEVKYRMDKDQYKIENEQHNGFYYGTHNWVISERAGGSANFVGKVTSKDMELVAKRTYSERKDEEIQCNYYFKDNYVYMTTESYYWHDRFIEKLVGSSLIDAITAEIYSNHIVIDENNRTYYYEQIPDEYNIRLVPRGLDKASHTLYEWFIEQDRLEDNVNLPFFLDLSNEYFKNEFEFLSPRTIGQEVLKFNKDEWVYCKNLNRYGRVAGQNGTSIRIIWEDQYIPDYSGIHYTDLERTIDPIVSLDQPKLVKFYISDYKNWTGYGWEIEEGIYSSRIELIGSTVNNENLKSYITREVSGNSWRIRKEDIEKTLTEYHGCIPNYLICNKNCVTKVTGIEKKAVEALLIFNQKYDSKNLLINLFQMADRNEGSYDYYLVQSLILQQGNNKLKLLENLSSFILNESDYKRLNDWFSEQANRLT